MIAPALELTLFITAAIRAHAAQTYPHECCGILLGTDTRILRALPALNLAEPGRERDRYVVDPLSILKAERAARTEGLHLLGFYHSHPDCPPIPSATDTALAWTGYLYLIVSICAGTPADLRAWQLPDAGAPMTEVLLQQV